MGVRGDELDPCGPHGPNGGFVTLPGSGQEGAGAEFRSGLDDRGLPVRHRFGSELSQG
jgi:hypothetical protein